MKTIKKKKIAKEWTVYDLGLSFTRKRPRLRKIIKKYSSGKVRRYLKKIT